MPHPTQKILSDSPRRGILRTVYKSRLVASLISIFDSALLLFFGDIERHLFYEYSTFFARTEKLALKEKLLVFEDKSSVVCREIFSAVARPVQKPEAKPLPAQTADLLARSESPYRLRYPGPLVS
jgi:hypothetical protein